jgi:hypothetical protein
MASEAWVRRVWLWFLPSLLYPRSQAGTAVLPSRADQASQQPHCWRELTLFGVELKHLVTLDCNIDSIQQGNPTSCTLRWWPRLGNRLADYTEISRKTSYRSFVSSPCISGWPEGCAHLLGRAQKVQAHHASLAALHLRFVCTGWGDAKVSRGKYEQGKLKTCLDTEFKCNGQCIWTHTLTAHGLHGYTADPCEVRLKKWKTWIKTKETEPVCSHVPHGRQTP